MSERKVRWTLQELLETEFPPLVYYIPKLLPAGLTLMWGKGKSGKSLLALQFAGAIGSGDWALGKLPAMRSHVVYLSFEDGRRRLQGRIKKLGIPKDGDVTFFEAFPTGQKGIAALERYLDEEPDTKVVFVDTMQRFSRIQDSNDYSQTVDATSALKWLADERDIAICAVHHSKKLGKSSSDDGEVDWMESAIGSVGFTTGPDHLLYLERTPDGHGDAVLRLRSKDATEQPEYALKFDEDIGGWSLIGDAREMAKTAERQAVLDVLEEAGGSLKTGDIAKALGKKLNTVNYLLNGLHAEGHVHSTEYGRWQVFSGGPHNPPETTETPESSRDSFSTFRTFRGSTEGSTGTEETEIF